MAMTVVNEGVQKPVEAKTVQEPPMKGKRVFVNVDTADADVIKWNAEGAELIFEHEKTRFKKLSDEMRNGLYHDNQVRYSMSLQLNEKHDPDNDEFHQRFKVGEMRSRRSEFEKNVRTTSQSARATKKLQAFVGEGFEPFWCRPDKLEDRLARGYEIVKDAPDVYAGVAKTDGHYETRVKQGETELILMRIKSEDKARILQEKKQAAERLTIAGENAGKMEIAALGSRPITGGDNAAWQDR